jgi:DNA-binding beta-propeller fold protein YncE
VRTENDGHVIRRGGRFAGCAAVLFAAFVAAVPAGAADGARGSDYAIVERWKLGGAGGWDYLTIDPPRHRLFVTHGDHVEVLDLGSGKIVGQIAGTAGVHGVVLAPDLRRGYTSNGRANTVTEFDYDTLAVLREVPVPGVNPDAMLYEAAAGRLFVFNGASRDATVFDARTLALVAQLPMPDKPEFAAADGRGHVYVNIQSERGQLVKIDAAKPAVLATWTLDGCARPTGLAIDRAHARLFSVCAGKVMVVTDTTSGRQVARVAIGERPDAAAFDAARGLVFSSNGEGTVTIVRAGAHDAYAVAATLSTQRGARTMALDPTTGRLYLVTAEFGPPPAATPEQPEPRAQPLPDSFTVLVAEPR